MRAALAARGYAPRHALQVQAIGRVATALFLQDLRARGARAPGDARQRLEPGDAASGRSQLPPRRHALPGRTRDAAAGDPGAGMSCAIHARDLRFTYPNGVIGLDGLDLHVTHGERVAVLGPNGAGKTTLMLHLNALLNGQGELEVAGLRVGHDDVRDLRARVGLIFQDPDDQLFMPTVREDVAFGPLNLGLSKPEVEDRVTPGARQASAWASTDSARPHQLSLGQRRRVAIATVLAMRPEPARARRAVREPRSAHPARADRDARRDRAHAADRHPRPAARRETVRARRPAVSGPDRRRPAHPRAPPRRAAPGRARPGAARRLRSRPLATR